MKKVTLEKIRDLAKLARVGLIQDEEESLAREMTAILEYVSELEKVDTTGVAPTAQVTGLINVLAEDEVADCDIEKHELLKNAPEIEDGFIKVKKVLE